MAFVGSSGVQLWKTRQPILIFFNNLGSDSVLKDLIFFLIVMFNIQDIYFLCVEVWIS